MIHNLVYLKYKKLMVIAFAGLMLYSHSTYPATVQESAQSGISLNPSFLDFELFSLQSSDKKITLTLAGNTVDLSLDEKITLTLAGNTVDLSLLESALETVKQSSYDVFAYVDGELKENITELIRKSLCPQAENPVTCWRSATQELQSIINETVGDIDDKQNETNETVSDKQNETNETVDDKQNETNETVSDKQDRIKETMHDMRDRIKEAMHDMRDRIKETVNDQQNETNETVDDQQDRIKETMHDMRDRIKEAMHDMRDRIKETVNDQQNETNETVDDKQNETNETVSDKQDKIYYPDSYFPIRGAPKTFKRAMKLLKSSDPCNTGCRHRDINLAVHYGSEREYSMLRDKIKDKGKKCQQDILSNLSTILYHTRLPKKCLLKKNKSHTVCSNMLKDLSTWRERITDIAEMAYGSDILSATSAQAPCTDCELAKINREISNLPGLINDLEEQSKCSDPKPGQQKIVHSDTPLNKKPYTVKREPDGSFSIPLYIDFSAGESYDGEVPRSQVPAHYMAKAQQCLKKANTKMLGPNGEKLNFDIQPPPQNQGSACAKDIIPISIASVNHRSNSAKYASDIDCTTITHEILHLTGLCDEYKERKTGFYVDPSTGDIVSGNINEETAQNDNYEFKPAYDCRVVNEPPPNIMGHHDLKWHAVFDEDTEVADASLLTPGQFNAILYGSCQAKNESFNRCSKLAYQSSHENPNCIEQKTQCSEQNAMGMNKTDTIRQITDEIKKLKNVLERAKRLIRTHELSMDALSAMLKIEGEARGKDSDQIEDIINRNRGVLKHKENISYYNRQLAENEAKISELQERLETAKNWPDQ